MVPSKTSPFVDRLVIFTASDWTRSIKRCCRETCFSDNSAIIKRHGDLSGISTWWTNTSLFSFDEFGTMRNSSIIEPGIFYVEIYVNDTVNNVASFILQITIDASSPPSWTSPPSTQIVEFGDSFTYSISATDFSGLDSWWINDSINFFIDQKGNISN